MEGFKKEREARIALLNALSRSQQAVARILDSVADTAHYAPGMAQSIAGNMKSIAAMQQSLTAMVRTLEHRPGKRRTGSAAAKPWLNSCTTMQAGKRAAAAPKGGNRSGLSRN
ncbi:hypothetical protein [Paenibacillus sp. R14(2021)]|uniref:hypothetical protein n=1 Tax=Paenibacillus sp. R14(2021) TaxID=2859228 RepID=UPI001C616550|nr:hypothetical protein [Paenibacillus sp. R14(2021)]